MQPIQNNNPLNNSNKTRSKAVSTASSTLAPTTPTITTNQIALSIVHTQKSSSETLAPVLSSLELIKPVPLQRQITGVVLVESQLHPKKQDQGDLGVIKP